MAARNALPVVLVVLAAALSGCAGASRLPGGPAPVAVASTGSVTQRSATRSGVAVLEVRPGTPRPGAAVLAGDAHAPSGIAPLPAPKNALSDVPPYWERCHASKLRTSVLECTLGDTSAHPRRVVALVGDSAAASWMIPLDAIGRARHWKIVTMLHTMCTWTAATTIHLLVSHGPYTACHTWGQNALAALLKLRPDAVISSDRPVVRTVAHPAGGPPAAVDVGRGLAVYWQRLLAAHVPVIAIRETPEPGRNMPPCLAAHGVAACSTPTPQAIVTPSPVTVAEQIVHGGASLVDLNRFICSTVCAPVVGNVEVYRDQHHLTQTFALTLAPYLERALLRVPALATG